MGITDSEMYEMEAKMFNEHISNQNEMLDELM
jgi:hypothetical protein